MVSGITSGVTNTISMIRASKAFSAAQKTLQQSLPVKEEETSRGIDLKDTNELLINKNIAEIQKFATYAGENNLSLDDIKYGLKYGRSVIADITI